MQIQQLSAHSFRNLKPLNIDVEAPSLILSGDNGQGKTNILEALYLVACGRSFRRASVREMVAHDQTQANVKAVFSQQGVRHHIDVQLTAPKPTQTGHSRQRLRIDDRLLKQAAQLLRVINVVAFFPDDLRIIKGSPEERRRFFDRAVAGSQPGFIEATLAYHRALKSRNAHLRGFGAVDAHLLDVFDHQLVQHGAIMHAARQKALGELLPAAQQHVAKMTDHLPLQLYLQSGVSMADAQPEAPFAHVFMRALKNNRSRDVARKLTLSGPHRADVRACLAGQDARLFASQGQQRALILALKLAELKALCQMRKSAPILVLDDVSSELDTKRLQRLFVEVNKLGCQVFVTTTGALPLPIEGRVQRLCVTAGKAVSSPL